MSKTTASLYFFVALLLNFMTYKTSLINTKMANFWVYCAKALGGFGAMHNPSFLYLGTQPIVLTVL